jgi:hypothetical protein
MGGMVWSTREWWYGHVTSLEVREDHLAGVCISASQKSPRLWEIRDAPICNFIFSQIVRLVYGTKSEICL